MCGAASPIGWRPTVLGGDVMAKDLGKWLGATGGVWLGATVGMISVGGVGGALVAIGGIVAGGGMGWSVGSMLGSWLDDQYLYPRRGRSVAEVSSHIARRVSELNAGLEHIAVSRKRVSASVQSATRTSALDALGHAEKATIRQLARYRLEKRRVELAWWNNRIEPLVAGWDRADRETCERWLNDLMAIVHDGKKLLSACEEDAQDGTAAAMRTAEAVSQGLHACEALRQALLVRQAQVVAQSSPGMDEAFSTAALVPIDEATLDRQRTADEIAAMVGDMPGLEEESLRLAAELDAIDEVERITDTGEH